MAKKKNLSPEDEQFLKEYQGSPSQSPTLQTVKIEVKCKNENQKKFLTLIEEKEIVLSSGSAGCGKTYLSCLKALLLLKKYPDKYRKIVLVKSVTTLEDEEIGFLKGGLDEKMAPFVYSFFSNFEKIIPKSLVKNLRDAGQIEIMPVAYCRGINFDNCIVIIDEAQNLTRKHIKTLMTRIGYDAKMIFLGDTEQIDLKKEDTSSLKWMIDLYRDFNKIGILEFSLEDVVRNPIIIELLEIYNNKVSEEETIKEIAKVTKTYL